MREAGRFSASQYSDTAERRSRPEAPREESSPEPTRDSMPRNQFPLNPSEISAVISSAAGSLSSQKISVTQMVLTGSAIGRLLTFYPKYHLEWQVDQLAGRAARAAGIGARWGRPSGRPPYQPASRFHYPLHLCPTLKPGRQEMGKGAPRNIQDALPVGALRGTEQRGTPAASPVTREVQLLKYIVYLFNYFSKNNAERPVSRFGASHRTLCHYLKKIK